MIITEQEGLHLLFLTYFTSLPSVWPCCCLAISCMNAPFYPNHSLDFFLRRSALGSRLGGQLFLFCSEVMYRTKRGLILISTPIRGLCERKTKTAVLAQVPELGIRPAYASVGCPTGTPARDFLGYNPTALPCSPLKYLPAWMRSPYFYAFGEIEMQ